MDIDLLISKKFDEFYKKNKRFVDINSDLKLQINPSEVKEYLDKSNLYYRLSAKRYLKIEWIINRMYDYLKNEGYYINNEIAEVILRDISKARSINRINLNKTFFLKTNIITKYELDLLKKSIIQKQGSLNKTNKDIINRNTKLEKTFTHKFFNDTLFNSNLEKDTVFAYNKHRIINKKMGQQQALMNFAKNSKVNDIRDLCYYCRILDLNININEAIEVIMYKRVAIYKIEPINKHNKGLKLKFVDSIYELRKLMSDRDWDCYYNYTIDKKFVLEELGLIFDITRERVRQIINKADRKAKRHKYLFLPFKEYLDEIIKYQDFVSVNKLMDSVLIEFGQTIDEISVELNILNHLFNTKYRIFEDKIVNFDENELKNEILNELIIDSSKDYIIIKKDELYNHVNKFFLKSPRKINRYLFKLIDNIIFDNKEEYVLIKRNRITNVDICKWILTNIGEPVHYSVVHEKYCEYVKNSDMSPRSIHATLDRSEEEGIIRTFTGTYGLRELGADKHVFAKDLAIKVLGKYNRPMHYTEIIVEVQKLSDAKDNTIYTNLNTSPEFISNNEGVYALKAWEKKLDENFQNKRVMERKIINHGYNKHHNYTIKYLIKESIFNDYTLRLPSNVPIKLDSVVKVVSTNNEEFIIRFNHKFNSFYRFDRVLSILDISNDDYIYLEILSPDYIRFFREHEYYMYLDDGLYLDNKKQTYKHKEEDLEDLLSLFYKEV